MAKKKAAEAAEFNMSEAIRDALTANPKSTIQEVHDSIQAKYPSARINEGSFSVAFYTGRQKLGITSKRRAKGKIGIRTRKTALAGGRTVGNGNIEIGAIKTAIELIKQAGGEAAAVELIKALGDINGNS